MQVPNIWGADNAPWMQALHFVFAVGGLIGPLIAKPFIYIRPDENSTSTDNDTSMATNRNLSIGDVTLIEDDTAGIRVWITYMIHSLMVFIVALALFTVYISGSRKCCQQRKQHQTPATVEEERWFICVVVTFICNVMWLYATAFNCINFHVVFLVKHVGLNKSKATLMNAAFWASFTTGRACGIGFAILLHPGLMLMLCVPGTMVFTLPQMFALVIPE